MPLLVSHPHWPGSGEEQVSPHGWAGGCSPLHSGAPLAGRTRTWDSRVTLRAGVARVLCRDCVWPPPVDTDVAPALQAACGPGLTVCLLLPRFHTCGTASERQPGAPGASHPDPPSPCTFFSTLLSGLFKGCSNLYYLLFFKCLSRFLGFQ